MELPQRYEGIQQEPEIRKFWEKEKIYKFNPDTKKEIFSIDTPPPTVSGKMHIGHAFSYSHIDIIARYKRMKGFELFYPFGTDDNGLATERLIEKLKNVKGSRMDRDEFVKLCLRSLEEIRPDFIESWKQLGISADFSIFYSTIDDHCRTISQKSFIDLYASGREYQKEAPTMWCPQCETAIAQVELDDVEMDSHFNDIIFRSGGNDIIISTTRPEMLCSCVAVFAHPDDRRYKKFFGKYAKVPLYNHEVPILPDEKADPEKGTGIVMCCTFGDQTDTEWWYKHNLPLKVGIDRSGKMTELSGKYKGLKVHEARKEIITDLKDAKLLIAQKPIKHAVKVHERCGTEIEFLKTKQWFIKYLDLKEKFLEAGKSMAWYPEFMRVRLDHWINGLQWDWCISRQRFSGVPFPLWYCSRCGAVKLADEKDLPVDPLKDRPRGKCACGHDKFSPEKDIMDTWATSSLTPMLAAELFKKHKVYKRLFPMSLRPQAHDIITFWLFNTMAKSLLHHDKCPWHDIMISGFALDPHGRKMSKSFGNTVDPCSVLQKYPADALRFWAAGSKLGEDMPYQEKDLVTGQKMITKLWNASKFAITNLNDYDGSKIPKAQLEMADRWLLSRLNRIIGISTEHFEKYEYSKTKFEVENFFWHTLCDNYLEIVKGRLYDESDEKDARKSAQYALHNALLCVIKLMAPIMPYITEAVYQLHFVKHEKAKSIHLSAWPEYDKNLADEEAEKAGDLLVSVVSAVRRFKSDHDKALNTPVKELAVECTKEQEKMLALCISDLKSAAKAANIRFGKADVMCDDVSKVKIGVVLG